MLKVFHICPTYDKPTCGIGRYSQSLYAELAKSPELGNCVLQDGVSCYASSIRANPPHIVHFQYEYGFASPERLRLMINQAHEVGAKFIATFHTIGNSPANGLPFDFLITHGVKVSGKHPNTKEFWSFDMPCPEVNEAPEVRYPSLLKNPFLVFGQAHPHKNFKRIFAWAESRNLPLLAIISKPVAGNTQCYDELVSLAAKSSNITMPQTYWSDEKILAASKKCRGAIFYYSEYGSTGISAAVRLLLRNPSLPIFCNQVSHFAGINGRGLNITWLETGLNEIPNKPGPIERKIPTSFTFERLALDHKILYGICLYA